ncbi:SDR family NAD(P)-dependent oxidoreductase [Micromonosporaceae bacterium DT194]|uniref:SDR family NAD(P)-dependent oxidoreductase n=1 Tax=Melissospora conviva TaxID=3388432 RepID=UPI003C28B1C5
MSKASSQPVNMAGKTVLVTGASSGIGMAAAIRLASMGARVLPVGRSLSRTAEVSGIVGSEPLVADFASLAQVEHLADRVLASCDQLDVLVLNAGAAFPRREVTEDGYEATFQVNHLAPFLLAMRLRALLESTARTSPVRVIVTSALGHKVARLRMDDLEWEKRPWLAGWFQYNTTKLMNLLFTRELARRWPVGIEPNCFHPGVVDTRFGMRSRAWRASHALLRGWKLRPEQGAAPLVHLAAHAEVAGMRGAYFSQMEANAKVHPLADDLRVAADLWEHSAKLLGVPAGHGEVR